MKKIRNLSEVKLDYDAPFLRFDAACKLYGIGASTMRALAGRAGAVTKIGRVVLIDREKVDSYLRDCQRVGY